MYVADIKALAQPTDVCAGLYARARPPHWSRYRRSSWSAALCANTLFLTFALSIGDIGTGAREIGYLFGAYKKIRNEWTGVLTGKGPTWGGSFARPEATGMSRYPRLLETKQSSFYLPGYGLIYYCVEMVPFITPSAGPSFGFDKGETRVLISGSGNVAQFAALKVIELGATVLSLSDSKGALISCDGNGFTKEDIEAIAELKLRQGVLSEAVREGLEWHEGEFMRVFVTSIGLTSVVSPSRQASLVARQAG